MTLAWAQARPSGSPQMGLEPKNGALMQGGGSASRVPLEKPRGLAIRAIGEPGGSQRPPPLAPNSERIDRGEHGTVAAAVGARVSLTFAPSGPERPKFRA